MSTDWRAKVAALLHASPGRAAALVESSTTGREELVRRLHESIGLSDEHVATLRDRLAAADRLASGVDLPPPASNGEASKPFHSSPEVVHPLSLARSGELLRGLTQDEWAEEQQALVDELVRIRDASGAAGTGAADWRRRHLATWRLLRERLRERDGGKAGPLWDVIPADARTPDHTTWDHGSLVSALTGAGATPGLFLLAISPVQDFIAAARKTQDLWAGSWILSWLAWRAMLPIVERLGPDAIVLPSLWGQPLVDHWLLRECEIAGVRPPEAALLAQASLPNRFLAIVPQADAAALGAECAQAFRGALHDLVDATVVQAKGLVGKADLAARVRAASIEQLDRYFHLRWVAVEWPGDWNQARARLADLRASAADDRSTALARAERLAAAGFWATSHSGPLYGDFYAIAERTLAAVKSTAAFDPVVAPPGARCSQTGDLPPVIQGRSRSPGEPETVPVSEDLAIGERLSAIVAVKRYLRRGFGQLLGLDKCKTQRLHFPSTGSIAAAPWLEELAAECPPEALDLARTLATDEQALDFGQSVPEQTHRRLEEARLRDLGYLDARLLFRGEGLPSGLDDDGNEIAPAVRNAIDRLLRSPGASRPSPYFALALADGDSMGEWLGGGRAPLLLGRYRGAAIASLPRDTRLVLDQERRPLSPALHGAISGALRTFSRELVPSLVESAASGKLIYSGGDDLLAVLPLRDVVSVLRRLPHAFSGTACEGWDGMRLGDGWMTKGRHVAPLMGGGASLSAGVVVAHQKEPFREVLEAARQAEQAAKALEGKAAFGIIVLKHSGQRLQFVAPWRCTNGVEAAATLDAWTLALSRGLPVDDTTWLRVSSRLVRSVHVELAPLVELAARDAASFVATAEVFTLLVLRHSWTVDPRNPAQSPGEVHRCREVIRRELVEPALAVAAEVALRSPTEHTRARGVAGPATEALGALIDVSDFLARHFGGFLARRRGDDAAA